MIFVAWRLPFNLVVSRLWHNHGFMDTCLPLILSVRLGLTFILTYIVRLLMIDTIILPLLRLCWLVPVTNGVI